MLKPKDADVLRVEARYNAHQEAWLLELEWYNVDNGRIDNHTRVAMDCPCSSLDPRRIYEPDAESEVVRRYFEPLLWRRIELAWGKDWTRDGKPTN